MKHIYKITYDVPGSCTYQWLVATKDLAQAVKKGSVLRRQVARGYITRLRRGIRITSIQDLGELDA